MFRSSEMSERVCVFLLVLVWWKTLSVFQVYNARDKIVQDWWNGMDFEGSGHGHSRGTASEFARMHWRKLQTPWRDIDFAVLAIRTGHFLTPCPVGAAATNCSASNGLTVVHRTNTLRWKATYLLKTCAVLRKAIFWKSLSLLLLSSSSIHHYDPHLLHSSSTGSPNSHGLSHSPSTSYSLFCQKFLNIRHVLIVAACCITVCRAGF
jgi:hypothetical protein